MENNDKGFGPPIAEFEITGPLIRLYLQEISSRYDSTAYVAQLFPVLTVKSSEECLEFLKEKKCIMRIRKGIPDFARFDMFVRQLPKCKWILFFDEVGALPTDNSNDHRVPCMFIYTDGRVGHQLRNFSNSLSEGDVLFGISEKAL
jgi:hypothetical protein